MESALIDIVKAAGDAVLDVYAGDFEVEIKADDSPLTQADRRAHRIIVDGLRTLAPEVPVISEESEPPPFAERRHWRKYWLVDPLDGTKEFVDRNGEFTVNVALIDAGEPVFGVVGVPAKGCLYVGDCRSGIAWREDDHGRTPLRTRALSAGTITVVASRRHGVRRLDGYLKALAETFDLRRVHLGSSLKFCVLAEGGADLYPRLGPTSEWDIAAAHAVLSAAGGTVRRFDGGPILYNAKESFLNADFFASGDPEYPWHDRLPPPP